MDSVRKSTLIHFKKPIRNRHFDEYFDEIFSFYRFEDVGEFEVQSNLSTCRSTIVVFSKDHEEMARPCLSDEIESSTPFGTKIFFQPIDSKTRQIQFTLDGSIPTRPDHQIQVQ